jgi:hypothetical protein
MRLAREKQNYGVEGKEENGDGLPIPGGSGGPRPCESDKRGFDGGSSWGPPLSWLDHEALGGATAYLVVVDLPLVVFYCWLLAVDVIQRAKLVRRLGIWFVRVCVCVLPAGVQRAEVGGVLLCPFALRRHYKILMRYQSLQSCF